MPHSPLSPDAEAFENALRANPDDLAGWCAYADYLTEHGDPRGEFMAVQIALEDENRPKEERKQLQAREASLLQKHEREWLDLLAPFVLDEDPNDSGATGTTAIWERGFVAGLVTERLSMELAHALGDTPATRFLTELHVHELMDGYFRADEARYPPPRVPTPEGTQHSELLELTRAPCMKHLRVFRIGNEEPTGNQPWSDCHLYTPDIEHVIRHLPRLEELHLLCKSYESAALFALPNLTNLRVLRMYHLGGRGRNRRYEYALNVLAANPAFSNLTHLLFHPHFAEEGDESEEESYLPLDQVRALVSSPHLKKLTHLQLRLSDAGDDGVRAIIASGLLKRLKVLDLRHGCVTDEGASLFAACPDAKNVESLDLSRNVVTAKGLAALRAAGVNAVANSPLTAEELHWREYLREGDSE